MWQTKYILQAKEKPIDQMQSNEWPCKTESRYFTIAPSRCMQYHLNSMHIGLVLSLYAIVGYYILVLNTFMLWLYAGNVIRLIRKQHIIPPPHRK